ncbi:MAG: thioesterase [bacterium]|nr:thioesterase [bacterium]
MYSFQSRVRYSEIDPNRKLDLAGIINYFQDCSTFQSEDVGVGIDYLNATNRVWIITNWQIVITRFPKLNEKIIISTWPYEFKTMFGYRNFKMETEEGELLAVANSIWVLMDTKRMRPTKLTEEELIKYELEEKYPMEKAPRKIPVPENYTTHEAFSVTKSNLDTNNHVNNGQYIKMATDYLPEDFEIKEMRAEYRKSAVLSDTIIPKVTIEDNKCTVVLAGTDDYPYCVVIFIKK